jgi:hypothetical protein
MRNRWRALALVFLLVPALAGCDPSPDTMPPWANGSNSRLMHVETLPPPGPNSPAPYTTQEAAVRVECDLTGLIKDDPLQPGDPDPDPGGSPHWHSVFGGTNFSADATDPRLGRSTCNGGSANKTWYWSPALFDISTFNNATPAYADAVPHLDGPYANPLQVYYKSAYDGVLGSMITQWYPPGLRMVAGGTHHGMTASPHIGWSCIDYSRADGAYHRPGESQPYWWDQPSIPPDCPAGKTVQLAVDFPQCGKNNPDGTPMLDSPDHRSHMSYAAGWPDQGCPSTHPRVYPKIEEFIRWRIPEAGTPKVVQGNPECTEWRGVKIGDNPSRNGWPTDPQGDSLHDDPVDPNDVPSVPNDHCELYEVDGDSGNFWLGSDHPDAPPGTSAHADWWNGWDPQVAQMMLDSCFGANSRDCRVGIVGKYINPSTNTWDGLSWWFLDEVSHFDLQP